MRRRAGLALLVLGVLVGASGCRLQLDLNTTVDEDGRGRIEVVVGLDPDAVERIGGDLDEVLEVGDLRTAGWAVDGPTLDPDGFTRVRVSKPFANAAEATEVFDQIASARAPFRDFAVTRSTPFASTEWGFTGRIDFEGGLEAFGDDGIAALLDGEPLGQSVEDIEAQLGEPLSEAIQVRVAVHLPGEVTSNATAKAEDGGVWQAAWGSSPIDLEATGEETRTATLVAAGIGATGLVLLVGYGLVRLVRLPRGTPPRAAHLVDGRS